MRAWWRNTWIPEAQILLAVGVVVFTVFALIDLLS